MIRSHENRIMNGLAVAKDDSHVAMVNGAVPPVRQMGRSRPRLRLPREGCSSASNSDGQRQPFGDIPRKKAAWNPNMAFGEHLIGSSPGAVRVLCRH